MNNVGCWLDLGFYGLAGLLARWEGSSTVDRHGRDPGFQRFGLWFDPQKGAIGMTVADSLMTREVMREISKRPVDTSHLEVHVMHGVVYLRGRLEKLRGYYEDKDLEKEHRTIMRLIRLKPGIIDVCSEVDYGGPTIKDRLREESRQHKEQQEHKHIHH